MSSAYLFADQALFAGAHQLPDPALVALAQQLLGLSVQAAAPAPHVLQAQR